MNITYRPIGTDWPGKRLSATQRSASRFVRRGRMDGEQWTPSRNIPWTDTLTLLDRELRALDAQKIVFQIDVREHEIRLDGQVRADARPADPAVIISFASKHGPLRYFCDQFRDWHDNVRAIALGLEALRKVERYGITHKGEQYAGWKQLPPGSGQMENVVLAFAGPRDAARFMVEKAGHDGRGVEESVELLLVHKLFRDEIFKRASKRVHPDVGGNRADWDTLVEARRLVETEAGGHT
jgi:hypothetical protein